MSTIANSAAFSPQSTSRPAPAAIRANISRRMAIARYFAIVAVVFVHIQPTDDAELSKLLDNPAFEFVRAFLVFGLFKYGLPVLTAISGWLLFNADLDRKYSELVAKKTRTLLIPLLFWTIPVAIGIYFAQKYGVLGAFLTRLYPFDAREWLNAVFSVTHAPVNAPLYFLRDLFVISLFAPVFGFFLRSWPYFGALLVAVIYWFNLDGLLVLENRLFVSFYIGGLAATLNWDLKRLDKYAVPLLAAIIAWALVIAATRADDIEWISILAPFWIWPVFSLLEKSRYSDFFVRASNKSFLIFVTHSLILFVLWKLYQPIAASSHYPLFWVISPFAVVIFCHLALKPFQKLAPRISRIALGGRVESEGTSEMPNLKGKLGRLAAASWEKAPIGIEQVDLRGPLMHVNRKLCDMLGYSRKELEKLSFRDITHPADLRNEEKFLSRLIRGKITSYSIEKRYLHKDGHAVPVRVTSSQVKGSWPRGGYRISIIEELGAVEDKSFEPRRHARFAEFVNRVLPRPWKELHDAIGRALAECRAYRDEERTTGKKVNMRTRMGAQTVRLRPMA
ncbi:MAG: acyltransferase family protein [Burkholderiales bacterium]